MIVLVCLYIYYRVYVLLSPPSYDSYLYRTWPGSTPKYLIKPQRVCLAIVIRHERSVHVGGQNLWVPVVYGKRNFVDAARARLTSNTYSERSESVRGVCLNALVHWPTWVGW